MQSLVKIFDSSRRPSYAMTESHHFNGYIELCNGVSKTQSRFVFSLICDFE